MFVYVEVRKESLHNAVSSVSRKANSDGFSTLLQAVTQQTLESIGSVIGLRFSMVFPLAQRCMLVTVDFICMLCWSIADKRTGVHR